MASIDDRIVKMEFDNAQFESGVAQTTTSLGNLKKALRLDDAADSLGNLSKAVEKIDVSGLNSATETVSSRFSALGTVATGALMSIGAKAAEVGATMLKSLTVQPIIDGFQEYETQMGAIQTIMANTADAFNDPMGDSAEHLAAVNAKLDELNTYADKTIYNFSEMTRNIGTFTAAGVDLDTATSAIQGISNLAAVSGSTSTQASTAMYQLSQALATGTVKLQDWNSVVNAGMGGKTFQDALIRTARHLNTGVDAAIKARGSFRESLRDGWLTSEVLTETLRQMTLNVDTQEEYNKTVADLVNQGYTEKEAQQIASLAKNSQDAATKVRTFTQLIDTVKEALGSGWTKSWQIIVGDFNEASEFLTGLNDRISDFVNKTSDARNAALQMWADAGGRQAAINIINDSLDALNSTVGEFAKGLISAIPADFPARIAQIMQSFDDEIRMFHIFAPHAKQELNEIGQAIGNVIRLISTPILTILPSVLHAVDSVLNGLEHTVLAVAGGIATFINTAAQPLILIIEHLSTWIATFISRLGDLVGQSIIRRIGDVLETIIHRIEELFAKIFEGNTIVADLANALNAADGVVNGFIDTIFNLADQAFGALSDAIQFVIDAFFDFLEAGVDVFRSFGSLVGNVFSGIVDFLKTIGSAFQEAFGPAFQVIGEQFIRIWNSIIDAFGLAADKISPVADLLSSMGEKAKEAFGTLGEAASEGIKSFGQFVSNSAPKVADFIINNIVPAVKNFADVAKDAFGNFKNLVSTNVLPILKNFADIAKDAFGKVGTFITGTFLPAVGQMAGAGVQAIANFIKAVKDFNGKTKSDFSSASDYVHAFAESVEDSFGLARNSLKPFADALGTVADVVQRIFSRIVQIITDTFSGVASAIAQFDINDIPNSLLRLGEAIGDAVVNHIIPAIRDGASLAFETAGKLIHEIASNLPQLFMDVILPAISDGFTALGKGALSLLDSFLDGLFGHGFDLVSKAFGKELDDAVDDATSKTEAKVSDGGGIGQAISGMFTGISDALSGAGSNVSGKIETVVGGVKQALFTVFGGDWEGLKERIDFVSDTIVKVSLAKFLSNVGDLFNGIKKFAAGWKKAASALDNAAKGFKRLAGAAELATFAVAIKAIVGAIKDVSDMLKTTDGPTVAKSIGIVAGILGALVGVLAIVDKITEMQPTKNVKSLGEGITGLMDVLNNVGKGVKIAGIGFAIMGLAVSVRILVEAFKAIADVDWGTIGKGIVTFGTAIGGFFAIAKIFGTESSNVMQNAISIGILAVSLKLIADTLQQLMELMKDAESFQKAADTLGRTFGTLVATLGALTVLGDMFPNGGSNILKSAVSIGILVLAIRGLVKPIQQLGALPLDQLASGTTAVIALLGALTASLAGLAFVTTNENDLIKIGTAIATVAAALKVLAGGIQSLAETTAGQGAVWSSLGALSVGLTAMSVALGILASTCSGGKLLMAGGALLMVSGALGILALAVSKLSESNPEDVASNMDVLGNAMWNMTAVLLILGNFAPQAIAAGTAMLILAEAVKIIADAVKTLSDSLEAFKDVGDAPTNIQKTLEAIGNGLAAGKSGIDKFLSGFAVSEVCDALNQLAQTMETWTDPAMPRAAANIQRTVSAISYGLSSGDTSGFDKLLSSFANNNVITGLTNLAGAVGAYKDIGNAPTNIGNVMDALNNHLPSFLQSVVSGGLVTSGSFSIVASGLGELGQSVKNYQSLGPDTTTHIADIMDTLNQHMPGITEVFAGPGAHALSTVASGLNELSSCLSSYASGDATTAATNIGTILDTIYKNMGNLGALFTGPAANALPTVASGLQTLAGTLETYGSDVAGVAATNITTLLDGIYKPLSKLGGLFAGGSASALPQVASGLEQLSGSLEAYSGDTASAASENIGKVLDAVYNHLHPIVGLLAEQGGGADAFSTVAGGLTRLSFALEKYAGMGEAATNIGTIMDTLKTGLFGFGLVRDGADALAVAAGSLDTLGQCLNNFVSVPADQVSQQLQTLQTAISNFSADSGNIQACSSALDSFGGSCDSLGGKLQGTADAVGNLAGKFWDVSQQVSSAADAMKSSFSGVADSVGTACNNAASKVSNLASTAAKSFSFMANNIRSGCTQSSNSVKQMVTSITTSMNQAANVAKIQGNATGNNFVRGISSKVGAASSAGRSLVTAATSAMRGGYGAAYSSGSYMGSGLANGLASQLGRVRSIAAQLASAAAAAMNAAAKVKSPSRVTMQTGRYMGEGLAIGMQKSSTTVERAASKMARSAIIATDKVADNIDALLAKDSYVIPIRPVVTGVELQNGVDFTTGFNTINSYQMGLDATMAVDNSSSDIYNELMALRSDLQNYTNEVMATRVGNISMGDVMVNSDQEIYDRTIDLIQDLRRRADMNDGYYKSR